MQHTMKKEQTPRTRRRDNGMAMTAGVSKPSGRERFSRSLALIRAALQVWEAKHGYSQHGSPWRRRYQPEAE